jgi:hypothetical protein
MLRSNLDALELELDAGLAAELAGLTEDPACYWRERSALPWN